MQKYIFSSRTAAQAKSRRDSRDALSCTPIIHQTVTIDVRACTIFFVLGFSIDRSEGSRAVMHVAPQLREKVMRNGHHFAIGTVLFFIVSVTQAATVSLVPPSLQLNVGQQAVVDVTADFGIALVSGGAGGGGGPGGRGGPAGGGGPAGAAGAGGAGSL